MAGAAAPQDVGCGIRPADGATLDSGPAKAWRKCAMRLDPQDVSDPQRSSDLAGDSCQ